MNEQNYIRTLQGRGQLARYLAVVTEVGFIRRSTDYHAVREATVYFDAKRNKLVRIGNEIGCTCGYPLYEVNLTEQGDAFHWLQRKDIAAIAEQFGATITNVRAAYDAEAEFAASETKPSRQFRTVIR